MLHSPSRTNLNDRLLKTILRKILLDNKKDRQALHARATAPCGQAGAEDHRDRRVVDQKKRHQYHIVVSDLLRERPIWFGGTDRSEASMDEFYRVLGETPTKRIRLAVMDMWRPFRNSTGRNAPQAAIVFDKFHIIKHLGEALDKVRRAEYHRRTRKNRRYIKGQVRNTPAVPPRQPHAGG